LLLLIEREKKGRKEAREAASKDDSRSLGIMRKCVL